jgi:hypothetical protein
MSRFSSGGKSFHVEAFQKAKQIPSGYEHTVKRLTSFGEYFPKWGIKRTIKKTPDVRPKHFVRIDNNKILLVGRLLLLLLLLLPMMSYERILNYNYEWLIRKNGYYYGEFIHF